MLRERSATWVYRGRGSYSKLSRGDRWDKDSGGKDSKRERKCRWACLICKMKLVVFDFSFLCSLFVLYSPRRPNFNRSSRLRSSYRGSKSHQWSIEGHLLEGGVEGAPPRKLTDTNKSFSDAIDLDDCMRGIAHFLSRGKVARGGHSQRTTEHRISNHFSVVNARIKSQWFEMTPFEREKKSGTPHSGWEVS